MDPWALKIGKEPAVPLKSFSFCRQPDQRNHQVQCNGDVFRTSGVAARRAAFVPAVAVDFFHASIAQLSSDTDSFENSIVR